jgi:hypothetical protein
MTRRFAFYRELWPPSYGLPAVVYTVDPTPPAAWPYWPGWVFRDADGRWRAQANLRCRHWDRAGRDWRRPLRQTFPSRTQAADRLLAIQQRHARLAPELYPDA